MPHSWLSNATAVMFTTKNEKETRTSAPFLCASPDPSGHRCRHHPLRPVLVPLKKGSHFRMLHCSLCQPVWRVASQDDPLRLHAVPTITDTASQSIRSVSTSDVSPYRPGRDDMRVLLAPRPRFVVLWMCLRLFFLF